MSNGQIGPVLIAHRMVTPGAWVSYAALGLACAGSAETRQIGLWLKLALAVRLLVQRDEVVGPDRPTAVEALVMVTAHALQELKLFDRLDALGTDTGTEFMGEVRNGPDQRLVGC